MNDIIYVRPQTPEENNIIYSINTLAFKREDEAMIIDRLRETDEYISELSLVAQSSDGSIIGHILFSKIYIVQGENRHLSLALAPMAVLPEFQYAGIGSKLVNNGLEKATGLGYESVIVLGHKNYYPRFGFAPASKWNINCPFEVPDDVYMAKELVPGALTGKSGTVRYSAAFNP